MIKYEELMQNWENFAKIIQNPTKVNDEMAATMIRRYSEQNIEMLNEVLLSSIDHLKRLQKAKSMNDIICIQARLTDDISKKLMSTAQKFFNSSMGNVSDYNEWLKKHCDLATD